jgi:hypothetical protein
VKLDKRGGALLLGIGVWNILTWSNFAKNLAKTARDPEQDRPRPYYIAHAVLIAVNSVIGGVLGVLGLKALRSR